MAEVIFDKFAEIYDSTIPLHIRNHYLAKRINFIKNIVKKGLVLDVACGTGFLDHRLEEEGFDVAGLDISSKMLSQALKRGCEKDICATATNLPFKSGTFDLVISVASLHHLVEAPVIYAAIREMVRVTKQGGAVLIWDHNPLNPYWPIFMKKMPQDVGVKVTIPLSVIVRAFELAGQFRITARRLGFMPDFVPVSLLKPFKILERIVEGLPLMNKLCAHNVVTVKKTT